MNTYRIIAQPKHQEIFAIKAATPEEARLNIDSEVYEILSIDELQTDYPSHAPHIRFEYDESHHGGNYSQVGDYAYVPTALVDQLDEETAFTVVTGFDAANIISYENTDVEELCTADGENWFEVGQDWGTEQAEILSAKNLKPVSIGIVEQNGLHQLELKVNDDETFATYNTATSNLELAQDLASRIKSNLTDEGLIIHLFV